MHGMTILRTFGVVVLVLVSIFVALAAIGIEVPGFFERAPFWLRAALIIGACAYLVFWFIADFREILDWFRRGGRPRR